MLDAIQEEGIEIRWEAPVEMVDSTSERIRVAIGDGTEFEAEYLIGADGAGSAVRSEIGVAFEGTESANSFIIVDVNEQPDQPRAQERLCRRLKPVACVDGRNVLLVPFQGGWRVDIQCKVSDDPERLTRDEQIADLVAKTLGERYRDRVEWVSEYKFKQVTADRMVDEHCRVLLTGEAGHLFAPFGARGMNSGVADVDLAADSIAVALAAQNDRLAEEKIKAYNIERTNAAEFNKMAAGQALEYLQGDGMYVKAKKRVAEAVANFWEPAGEWLDDAPYGPHGGPRVNIGQY
jgi:3-(3-hydroxy-phenyl)propionate hydroxylase